MHSRSSAFFPLALAVAACASHPPAPPQPPPPTVQTTASAKPNAPTMHGDANIAVSDEIARACNIQFGNVERAPKFDFAQADVLPEERAVLEQVARCVTTGPLKGRGLRLVGRADPRGEVEYNMTLGAHRAEAVRRYLAGLGVDDKKMSGTSRGKLDATGTDEEGWRRDRRVDISLE